jgi:hypothetical protein
MNWFEAGSEALCSEIRTLIASILNKEDVSQQWAESSFFFFFPLALQFN